jgi:hypothetical protein
MIPVTLMCLLFSDLILILPRLRQEASADLIGCFGTMAQLQRPQTWLRCIETLWWMHLGTESPKGGMGNDGKIQKETQFQYGGKRYMITFYRDKIYHKFDIM